MGLKNKIYEGYTYYMTLTVVEWVDIFTRPIYKQIIVDSLKYCQEAKGLEIYGWVLMSNHLHLLASARKEGVTMSDILRDFKKFTSKKIVKTVLEEPTESRKDWLSYRFDYAGRFNPKIKDYKFWQDGNEAKEIHTAEFFNQKLNYIHNNPVRADIVEFPEEYLYSSARNYARRSALLDVVLA